MRYIGRALCVVLSTGSEEMLKFRNAVHRRALNVVSNPEAVLTCTAVLKGRVEVHLQTDQSGSL